MKTIKLSKLQKELLLDIIQEQIIQAKDSTSLREVAGPAGVERILLSLKGIENQLLNEDEDL